MSINDLRTLDGEIAALQREVAELKGELMNYRRQNVDDGLRLAELRAAKEAAEQRCAELAGLLSRARKYVRYVASGQDALRSVDLCREIDAALAASPKGSSGQQEKS